MADYPASIIAKAAEAIVSLGIHGSSLKGLDTRQEAQAIAAAVLDAVAADLGEAVAARILEHMEATTPALRVTLGTAAKVRRNMRRIHYQTAARVAARAFLTEDDVKRMAAEAIARGDFARCPSLEEGDG